MYAVVDASSFEGRRKLIAAGDAPAGSGPRPPDYLRRPFEIEAMQKRLAMSATRGGAV
jgi:hypothetical protein